MFVAGHQRRVVVQRVGLRGFSCPLGDIGVGIFRDRRQHPAGGLAAVGIPFGARPQDVGDILHRPHTFKRHGVRCFQSVTELVPSVVVTRSVRESSPAICAGRLAFEPVTGTNVPRVASVAPWA